MKKKPNNLTEEIKTKVLERSFEFVKDTINIEERTVEISFSSEFMAERWFGFEILDHSRGSADLSELNNSAPLLLQHDDYIQIGVVVPGTARIDTDLKGRCTVKFSKKIGRAA